MLHKTRGIVFKFFRYGETSVIVKMFTAAFGIQTYIINGVRKSGKGKARIALLQPLTLLELIVYHKENADIQRISEIRCETAYRSIPVDVRKSSIALFLSEVLYKSVREQQGSDELYEFIHQSLLMLDTMDRAYENFHLQFLIRLSGFLGFGLASSPSFMNSFTEDEERTVMALIRSGYAEHVPAGHALRRTILQHLLDFYGQHVDGFGEIKSVKILQEIL